MPVSRQRMPRAGRFLCIAAAAALLQSSCCATAGGPTALSAAQQEDSAILAASAGACAAKGGRKVRFWVGYSGAGGAEIIDRATNASCSAAFLGNLTLFKDSIDSLSFEAATLESNASGPALRLNGGELFDAGLAACVKQIKHQFNFSIGLCSSTGPSAGNLNVAAAAPPKFVADAKSFISGLQFPVDEFWVRTYSNDVVAFYAPAALPLA